jgi:lysozyme
MPKITTVSSNCVKLITHFETGDNILNYLKAYQCPAKVWTIGIGTTVYPNGTKVKAGDVITLDQANEYLMHDLKTFQVAVDSFTTDLINQSQFDALVSFTYNLGAGALKSSTLLKKVNINPNDPTIQAEFEKWVYAGNVKLQGLIRRRKSEAFLYFKGQLKFNF